MIELKLKVNTVVVLVGPSGCHAKGTSILMYDGTTKKVEDVLIGDLLMGPDSLPREVLRLNRGKQEMAEIKPTKGTPFIVNLDHILSLQKVSKRYGYFPIENISVREWLCKSNTYRSLYKLYRASAIDFCTKSQPLPIPPYILGLWLGDGHSHCTALTTMDEELRLIWENYAKSRGLTIKPKQKIGNKATTYYISPKTPNGIIPNTIRLNLIELGVLKNKHIPHCYLTSSQQERLELLAGLLDTDGSLNCNFFEIMQKRKGLAKNIRFLARSLGFAAYMKKRKKVCTNTGVEGTYYAVYISGHVNKIPTRLPHKKASKRLQIKNVLRTGFTVHPLPEADYYGFEVTFKDPEDFGWEYSESEHLYLTGDFTVTHNCGKSYFSKKMRALLKTACALPWRSQTNIQYLSSDDLRRELLGGELDYDRNTPQMMAVSEQAFDLLYKKLELVTSYPVSAEIVIVDTTGLNNTFRDRITKIAKDANYTTCCVVFDYKDRDDYYKYIQDTHDLSIVSAQLKRFHRETLGQIKKRDFDISLYIRKKNFDDIDIVIEDAKDYCERFLPSHLEYPIIGDIHGCFDEFMELLKELRFTIEDSKVVDKPSAKVPILLGDYIDGDPEGVEKIINFLYENKEHFKLVVGNHENFNYLYYNKQIDERALPPKEVIDNYFPTTALLAQKPELAQKFCALREISKDFFIGHNFIVTHSPCLDSALGKMHSTALRNQRNFRYPQRQEHESTVEYSARLEDALSFLKSVAASNKPIHVFGHVRVQNAARIKNKVGIDTGCVQGNRLTAATIVGNKVYFTSVSSKKPKTEELPEIFSKKDAAIEILPEVDLNTLEPKEIGRIKYAASHKVNYVSGTMSPADKDPANGKLESIGKALEYFKSKEVESVCLQPKYMGSRAEVFLNCRDITKSYTTTRRGHVVDHIDLTQAYDKLLSKVGMFAAENDFEWLFLDCELMPWFALGRGLIESQYKPCQYGLESEIKLLKETNFETALERLCVEYNDVGYAKLSSQIPKEALRQQLTSHKCASYEAIKGFQWIPLAQQEEYFDIYKRQLELFATPGEIEFKPFAILKGVRADNSESLFFDMPNSKQFSLVSNDECLVIALNDEAGLEKAEAFFNQIVERELEGVVVKPEQPYIKGVAPYMKVRNPNYLTIIYGENYTYPAKYERLLRQKKIGRKLQCSIDEYEYGKRMLEIPRHEISIDNKEYVSLFARMILEEHKEEKFDPRL